MRNDDHDRVAVFFGGPPGVGKRQLLRALLADNCCAVSMLNYRTLRSAYSNNDEAVLRHLLARRVGKLIYEHTVLCLLHVHRVVREEVEKRGRVCEFEGMLEAYGFYEACRKRQQVKLPSGEWREHRMLFLLDLRGNYFRRMLEHRLPGVYHYAIAYLAIMAEQQRLYPRARMLIVVDEHDEDRTAARLGLYELAKSLATRRSETVSLCKDSERAIHMLRAMHRS